MNGVKESIHPADIQTANLEMGGGLVERVGVPRLKYGFECIDEDGNVRWQDGFDNIVTFEGQNDLLTQYFKGVTYTAAWFVGLIDDEGATDTPVETDTAAAHPGWVESTEYSEATRPALTLGTASAGSINNSAARATYNINNNTDLKGGFVISNNTKGGATGVLYSAGLFSSPRQAFTGDVLNVTVTLTV